MTKQAAALLALGFAGAAITALFAFMLLQTNRDIWGWASLIVGVCTVCKLASAATSKSKDDSTSET